jgi:hypothetical protein
MSFESWLERAQAQISTGNNPNLFRWIYIEVDSVVTDDVVGNFDIADLQEAGLEGWDVVAVIPKTLGIGLTNTSTGSTFGTTWGGGVGGNILGVYLILSKEVYDLKTQKTLDDARRIVTSLEARGVEF